MSDPKGEEPKAKPEAPKTEATSAPKPAETAIVATKTETETVAPPAPATPPTTKASEPAQRRLAWFISPTGGAIGWFCTVISLIFGVWGYFATKDKREITYSRQPTDTVIFATGQATKISAMVENAPMNADISAAQVTIWNTGNRALHKQEILRAVTLDFGKVAILDVSVRAMSRDVTEFKAATVEPYKDFAFPPYPNAVSLDWKILEPGDGATVQIVYVAKPGAPLAVTGVVEGGSIRAVNLEKNATRVKQMGIFVAAGLLILAFGTFLIGTNLTASRRRTPEQRAAAMLRLFRKQAEQSIARRLLVELGIAAAVTGPLLIAVVLAFVWAQPESVPTFPPVPPTSALSK